METLNLEKLYPDLFAGMSPEQVKSFNASWAPEWHEGWNPNRESVEMALRAERGEITLEHYRDLVLAKYGVTGEKRTDERV